MNVTKYLWLALLATCPLSCPAQNGPCIINSKDQLARYFQGCQKLAEIAAGYSIQEDFTGSRGEFESFAIYQTRMEEWKKQLERDKLDKEKQLAEECVKCFGAIGEHSAKLKLDVKKGEYVNIKTITLSQHVAIRIPVAPANLSRFNPDELTFKLTPWANYPFEPQVKNKGSRSDLFYIDGDGAINDLNAVTLPPLPPLARGFEFPKTQKSAVAKNATLFIKRPWPSATEVKLKFRTIEDGERFKRSVDLKTVWCEITSTVVLDAGQEEKGGGGRKDRVPTSQYGAYVTATSGHKPVFADASPGSYDDFVLEKKPDGARQLVVEFISSAPLFMDAEGKKIDVAVTVSR